MQEYEDHFDLDDELESLDIITDGVKRSLDSANEKPHRSTREKNPVSCYDTRINRLMFSVEF